MFEVAFDFDFEKYKANIADWQKRNTKPYYFTPQQRNDITNACKILAQASAKVVLPCQDADRDSLMNKWFGAGSPAELVEVSRKLDALDDVIGEQARTVTFVDGSQRQIHIKMNPDDINQYPTWIEDPRDNYPPALLGKLPTDPKLKRPTLQEMSGAGAWVFPLPGGVKEHGTYHVGSGLRIVLGQAWSGITSPRVRAAIIYHELTHKILGTNDHCYGEQNCENLAQDPARKYMALKNADNYNCFIDDYMWLKNLA